MNVILPDQYLGISVPGQMYAEEYDRRGMSRVDLSRALLCGGAITSPLVPWNTCGIYCSGILGVATMSYLPMHFSVFFSRCCSLCSALAVHFSGQRKRPLLLRNANCIEFQATKLTIVIIPFESEKQRLSALLFCACGSKSPYGIIRKQTIERRGTDGYRANETILSRA